MEHLTTETFKEKIFNYTDNKEWIFEGTKPAIVDFYAEWCGPCKQISPILEELSKEYPGIDIYKVDTEAQPELSSMFGVQSIPSILFVPMQSQPQMAQGGLPKDSFIKAIKDILLIEK